MSFCNSLGVQLKSGFIPPKITLANHHKQNKKNSISQSELSQWRSRSAVKRSKTLCCGKKTSTLENLTSNKIWPIRGCMFIHDGQSDAKSHQPRFDAPTFPAFFSSYRFQLWIEYCFKPLPLHLIVPIITCEF